MKLTGPWLEVCRMNLPSNFSDAPSMAVSVIASPSSSETASG
jgi:hypothetical protein